jgi:hypothetical protein
MATVAAINRLVHDSVIMGLKIPSYRLDAAKRDQLASTSPNVSDTEDC